MSEWPAWPLWLHPILLAYLLQHQWDTCERGVLDAEAHCLTVLPVVISAVEVVCREGPARVLELVKFGAEFTRNKDGSLHLTREGGHSNRRIVHAADLTGELHSERCSMPSYA